MTLNKFMFLWAQAKSKPPTLPMEKYESFCKNLKEISQQLPGLQDSYLPSAETAKIQLMLKICSLHNLYQINDISNANHSPNTKEYLPPLDNHHSPLLLKIHLNTQQNTPNAQDYFYYDFLSTNLNEINEYLGIFL